MVVGIKLCAMSTSADLVATILVIVFIIQVLCNKLLAIWKLRIALVKQETCWFKLGFRFKIGFKVFILVYKMK